jgi:hypothetical protein
MGTVIIIPADPDREIYQASHPDDPSESLAFLRRHIECSLVECVGLLHGVDMWLDEEAPFARSGAFVNDRATALARSLNPRTQPYYGNVVITGYNPANRASRNLKEGERDLVLGQLERALVQAR